jgi:hypothetical protein
LPKKKDESLGDMKVEELTLDDLQVTEKDVDKGKGGLRAGGLGPEGSRYSPPEGPKRRTWKPKLAGALLIAAAFVGAFLIVNYLLAAPLAEGKELELVAVVYDYDAGVQGNKEPLGGILVTVDGTDLEVTTDSKGHFEMSGVPGGKITMRFYKRDWDEAVNATLHTLIVRDSGSEDDRSPFYIKVHDLDTINSVPKVPDSYLEQLRVEVLDWTTKNDPFDTVNLRVHASSFDHDLSTYSIQVSEDKNLSNVYPYGDSNDISYTFGATETAPTLFVSVITEAGITYIDWVPVELTSYPFGSGGWLTTEFPDVSTFVRGGPYTTDGVRTVDVYSAGGVNFSIDGGTTWNPMTEGHAEVTTPVETNIGVYQISVIVQNASGEQREATVMIFVEPAPPLDPEPARGPAVTDRAIFRPMNVTQDAVYFIRYQTPVGTWSPWQLYLKDIPGMVIDVDDDGSTTDVVFEAMNRAGETVTETGSIQVLHQAEEVDDVYASTMDQLKVCAPIMVVGVILALFGGYFAWNRKRPTLAMIGCIGALLASAFTLVGVGMAFIAIILIMFSREEFEQPAPAPGTEIEPETEE